MTTPRLVILAGLPGSGKTTLANWMCDEHDFVVASRDTIRIAMFPQCQFTDEEKSAAYLAMKNAIDVMLAQGRRVVTDGMCFSSRRQLDEVRAIAAACSADVDVIHCRCPVDVAQRRVEADRHVDPDVPADRDAELVVTVDERFEPLPDDAHIVEMARPLADIRRDVVSALGLEEK